MREGHVIALFDMTRPAGHKRTGYYWTVPELHTRGEHPGRSFYMAQKGLQMDRNGSSFALRLEWANDILRANYSSMLYRTEGYYTDDNGDGELMQPIVARLPHSRGFLAGWTMGNGMLSTLDGHIWEDENDAAREAHRMAERDAEREREYQREERERERIEEEEEAEAFERETFAL